MLGQQRNVLLRWRAARDGTDNSNTTPVLVSNITTARSNAVDSDEHSCALLLDGKLICCGVNYHGILGEGSSDGSFCASPVEV